MEENENNNKETNKSLISFAKINKYFLIPFLCPIFCISGNFFINKIIEDKGLKNKEFLLAILECLSYTGGGFLYFISSLREKTAETRDKARNYIERNTSIKLIYNDSNKIKRSNFKIGLLLFISSLCVSFFDICEVYSLSKNTFEERFYIIFFLPLFSKLILKLNIYNHQILSLCLSFIGLILIFLPTALIITENDIIINILFFIASIGFSLYLILIKYLTHTYFMSPYLCLLFIGSISSVITFIYFVIYYLIFFNDKSFIFDSFNFSEVESGKLFPIFIILVYIFGAILQTLSFLVIYYFTPTLLIITDFITPLLLWIINIFIEGEKKINLIFLSCGYFITIFASLIYNEIIIFNFCNLNKHTKKILEEKQKEEYVLLNRTELENSQVNNENNDNNNNDNNNNDNNNNDNNNDSENDSSNISD